MIGLLRKLMSRRIEEVHMERDAKVEEVEEATRSAISESRRSLRKADRTLMRAARVVASYRASSTPLRRP